MDEHAQPDVQQPQDNQPSAPEENHSSDVGAQPRRRLGRGLSSLIGGGPLPEEQLLPSTSGDAEFAQVPVDAIEANPYQPRKHFDPDSINELCESIKEHGILQPLLVRNLGSTYQLVAGERRLIAARKAGIVTVPCRVVDMPEQVVCEVAIVENLQRADLGDIEKAQAFQRYLDQFGGAIEDLARRVGKDRSTVSNLLRLLELPDFVKMAIQTGKISASHGRALLPLEEEADQIAMCQQIQSESLSVRSTEEEVRTKLAGETLPFPDRSSKNDKVPVKVAKHVLELQQQLRDLVGVKVELKMKGKDSGKMVIHFSSHDEFERIVSHIKKAS